MNVKEDFYFSTDLYSAPGYADRFKHLLPMMLDHIRLDKLAKKRVVDLGCGSGYWGKALLPYETDMIFVDGRESNLIRLRHDVLHAKAMCMDVERDLFWFGHVDLVLAMGIIYHINDPAALFRKIARISPRVFVDTTVIDHDGDLILHCRERTDANFNSLNGAACRPSPAWVVRELKEAGFHHVRDVSAPSGNLPPMPGYSGLLYDWEFQRTGGWRRNECTLRKMYVASKNADDELLK